ncbi:sulfite exporter TauE/SafE family protein [Haladaptatus sp. DYF46]|uniref:sulfite exporter TauE/SafE family protein n=1 Tax=Haladaptatus sp. DYF46 TaxID=2886041 RepID=UPI001E532AC6|nr:sulfite exporter TauE/SafE family protein [Haladaptatus sp. DYF46]
MSGESAVRPEEFVRNLRRFRYRELLMAFATVAVVVAAVGLFPGAENVTNGLKTNATTTDLALFVALIVLAAMVKGMVGFGFALIATPLAASVMNVEIAVVVLAVPPWMINVFQVGETNTGLAYVRREWSLIGLALVGSVAGVFFFSAFKTSALVTFLIGVVLFGYVLFQLGKGFVSVEGTHNPVALGIVGLLEGFLLGAANLGPLLPTYLHTFERDKERYVGGLSMVLGLVFTAKIVQMLATGVMTTYHLWLGSALAVVTLVGLFAGTYLRRVEIDERKFNWLVVTILLVISLKIFSKTVPALFL